jgi:hypothetical protein
VWGVFFFLVLVFLFFFFVVLFVLSLYIGRGVFFVVYRDREVSNYLLIFYYVDYI